ncbi:hypothetical protein FRB95_006293 [Tulasnella sp. JGI-2019a]|nr:hypothetical protein FRB95_006293 [Tulasnella sp. JGI-2019a]
MASRQQPQELLAVVAGIDRSHDQRSLHETTIDASWTRQGDAGPLPLKDVEAQPGEKSPAGDDIVTQTLPPSETPTPEEQQPALVIRWVDRGTLIPTLQNPRTYTKWQKISIVFIVALSSFSAPFASNIMMPSFPFIGPRLKLSSAGVTLTTTLFLVALGIGPLYHAFLSERYGRRPGYLAGFIVYTLASVACALSPTGRTLITFRFIQAFGASAAQSLGIGTIADIYVPAERGRATGFWFLGPILGPTISPLVGGAIYAWHGWRAILWATAVFGVILTILIILFLPETSLKLKSAQAHPEPTMVPNQDQNHSVKSILSLSAIATYDYGLRPLGTIFHLFTPSIFLPSLYSTLCFGSLYALSVSLPFIFSSSPFHFKSMKISVLYLPNCAGYCIGSVLGGYLSDWEIRKARRRSGTEQYPPEVRLNSARWGIPLLPMGLLLFGWSACKGDDLVLPLIGGFTFGVGLMLTNGTIMAYLADAVPGKTASVVAAYNAMRNIFAGLMAAITTTAIQSGLHVGWYMTVVALVCLVSSLALEVVQRLGPGWRDAAQQRIAREEEAAKISPKDAV